MNLACMSQCYIAVVSERLIRPETSSPEVSCKYKDEQQEFKYCGLCEGPKKFSANSAPISSNMLIWGYLAKIKNFKHFCKSLIQSFVLNSLAISTGLISVLSSVHTIVLAPTFVSFWNWLKEIMFRVNSSHTLYHVAFLFCNLVAHGHLILFLFYLCWQDVMEWLSFRVSSKYLYVWNVWKQVAPWVKTKHMYCGGME